jgi:hypothetical protein
MPVSTGFTPPTTTYGLLEMIGLGRECIAYSMCHCACCDSRGEAHDLHLSSSEGSRDG